MFWTTCLQQIQVLCNLLFSFPFLCKNYRHEHLILNWKEKLIGLSFQNMMHLVTVNTEGAVAFHIGWRSFFPASVTSKWISPLSPHTDWNTVLWSSNPPQKHPVSSFQRSANSPAFSWNHKWDGTSLSFWMYSIGQKVLSGVLYLMGESEQTFWPTHYFQTNVSLSPLSFRVNFLPPANI